MKCRLAFQIFSVFRPKTQGLSDSHAYVCCLGVLGIKVKIMLPWDPTGKMGPKRPLPDNVSIVEPKEETNPAQPYSESKTPTPVTTQQPMGGAM